MSAQSDQDDAELVRRCVAGEAGAWDAFAERFTPLLAGAIRHTLRRFGHGGDEALVRDLVQDAFAALLQDDRAALRRYDPAFPLDSYLALIASRRCLRWIEKRHAEKTWEQLAREQPWERWLRGALPDSSAADAAIEAARLRERVARALEALPERERLAVRLSYWNELPAGAIGRVLGLRPGAVWTLLSRARKRLRELLKNSSSFCLF